MDIVEFTVEKVLEYFIDLVKEPIKITVVKKINDKNNIYIFIMEIMMKIHFLST